MTTYTYPIGLLVMGLFVFLFGMLAAKREREARDRTPPRTPEQLPLDLPSAARPSERLRATAR